MRLIDAHEDIAWGALTYGRDFLRSAWETRRLEEGTDIPQRAGRCMLGLPECLEGGVAVVFGTIFSASARSSPGSEEGGAAEPDQASRLAWAELEYYLRLAEQSERVEIVEDRSALEGVLSSWEGESPRVGVVLLMEGADALRRPSEVEEWYRRGVRLLGPAWAAGSRYAGGNRAPGPLTEDGRRLLEAIEEVGMVLDLSHLSEEAFWESVDRYAGVLVVTHANPRAFVPGPRQLSDQMIRAVAERGGVMGVVPCNRFLRPDWSPVDGKEAVTLQDLAAAIDHVCQVVGDAAHVGLGSDFDGGFGAEATPAGMETVADLIKIAHVLAERGWAQDDVSAVMGGNWLRVLQAALPPG